MRAGIPLVILTFAALGVADGAASVEVELDGKVSTELRSFPREPRFPTQDDDRLSPSVALEPEIVAEPGDGAHRLTLRPFLRLDAHDAERTHFDLRLASWLYLADRYTLVVGFDRVFWGVTESRHLVDVINQTDAVEDLDGEEKLGQPMVNVTIESSVGTLDLFWLPYFRERTFSGPGGRLRGFLPVSDDASYESAAGRWHQDWAVRYSLALGAVDVGLAHFRGTSREPRFLADGSAGLPRLTPRYDLIDQTSLDVQWTRGAWLWKLEAIARSGHGERFAAAVAGFEYTLFNTFPRRSADLGLLLEALVDGRGEGAPPTIFENDVFVGFRWALNDVQSTQILGGPIVDWQTGETLLFLEAERRLGHRWLLEADLRWFLKTSEASPAAALERDGVLTVKLTRYF